MIDGTRRSRYLTAAEAAALLAVSRSSLYAYVSRGVFRGTDPRNPRASRYLTVDIERLRAHKEARLARTSPPKKRSPGGAGPGVELTLIDGGRFYYRGHDALAWPGTRRLKMSFDYCGARTERLPPRRAISRVS